MPTVSNEAPSFGICYEDQIFDLISEKGILLVTHLFFSLSSFSIYFISFLSSQKSVFEPA